MSASSTDSVKRNIRDEGQAFVAAATAAMRRAARQAAAENKRFGLPLIVERPERSRRRGK